MIRALLDAFAKLPTPLKPPRLPRHVPAAGLKAAVDVLFDAAGVPHIFARNESDAYFAQGYFTARDRLFQMDFLRRAISGRLAEVLGDASLPWRRLSILFRDRGLADADTFFRMLGLRRAALESLGKLSARTSEALYAYCEGVNACIAEGHLPPEFRYAGFEPDPWVPVDSLAILKGYAFELNVSWRSILFHDVLSRRFPERAEAVAQLFPTYPRDALTVTRLWNPDEELQRWLEPGDDRALALLMGDNAIRNFVGFGGAHAGSNAWVISGKKSATGFPIVCCDPHLQLTAPCPFYAAHLSGGNLEVGGATLPGVPGVIIGYNRRVAWGVTAGLAHDTDIFIEKVNPENRDEVQSRGEWLPLSKRTETIRVKGRAAPVVREVRESNHGCIISDLFDAFGDSQYIYAMQWTATQPGGDLEALMLLNRARDFNDFRAALAHHSAPALNVVYGDVDGHIGYQYAGQIPIRTAKKNLVPMPGWDGEFDWRGTIPFNELPHLYDPREGVIVTANNKVVDDRYPYYISVFWEPPYRHQRIVDVLSPDRQFTLRDMQRLQGDSYSAWARGLIDKLVRVWSKSAAFIDVELEEPLRVLLTWDGEALATSIGATIFNYFYAEFCRQVFKARFGDDLFRMYFEVLNQSVMPLENLIVDPTDDWVEPNADMVGRALRNAVRALTDRLGPDINEWQWGRPHSATMRHRLSGAPFIAGTFDLGPLATGGDGMTVNNGYFLYNEPFAHWLGPTLRLICDLGNPNNNQFVLSTGQSGHPFSKHYNDHLEKWAFGGYFRLGFDRGELERQSRLVTMAPR